MPRGSGKSTLARIAALWAAITGRRVYVVLIAANADKAKEDLAKIRTICETNLDLISDFPEVFYPITKLGRVTQRQRGQTYLGKPTRISWLARKLVFPTIAGSRASGAILTAAGLQGSDIRGQSHQTADGKIVRPDLAIPDDPQTRSSAVSDLQCNTRETLLKSDVLGMAGPKKKLALVGTCTVIRKGDLADRLLDRKANPQWRGIRLKLLNSLPKTLDLWSRYAELRRNSGDDGKAATEFYRDNRDKMDEGADATWPARFNSDEISAVQFAMNLRIDDPETFASEYQNEPETPDDKVARPTLEKLSSRLNRLPRAVLPNWTKHLVTMIDVQDSILYYQVVAADDDFSAAVVEYGTEPEQPSSYFACRDVQDTLGKRLAAAGEEWRPRGRALLRTQSAHRATLHPHLVDRERDATQNRAAAWSTRQTTPKPCTNSAAARNGPRCCCPPRAPGSPPAGPRSTSGSCWTERSAARISSLRRTSHTAPYAWCDSTRTPGRLFVAGAPPSPAGKVR